MTVQDILNELDLNMAAGEVEEAVKKEMPDYKVAAYDDDQELGDSYSTTEVIATFIQNSAENKVLLDIDIGNVLCEDEYGHHSYTVIAVKTKEA